MFNEPLNTLSSDELKELADMAVEKEIGQYFPTGAHIAQIAVESGERSKEFLVTGTLGSGFVEGGQTFSLRLTDDFFVDEKGEAHPAWKLDRISVQKADISKWIGEIPIYIQKKRIKDEEEKEMSASKALEKTNAFITAEKIPQIVLSRFSLADNFVSLIHEVFHPKVEALLTRTELDNANTFKGIVAAVLKTENPQESALRIRETLREKPQQIELYERMAQDYFLEEKTVNQAVLDFFINSKGFNWFPSDEGFKRLMHFLTTVTASYFSTASQVIGRKIADQSVLDFSQEIPEELK